MRCAPTQRPSGIPMGTSIPIKSNMQSKTSPKPLLIPEFEFLGDSTMVFRTEDTPANISHATSHSDLSNLCALSDDSDHDNILAECIQSGMPQARLPQNSSSLKKPAKVATVLPMLMKTSLLPLRQNQSSTAPSVGCKSSPRLKLDQSQQPHPTTNIDSNSKQERFQLISPVPDDRSSPLSSIEPDLEEAVTVLSRQPSTGSLSGDWTEEQVSLSEQQLLEQCITSGMPKTKNGINPSVGATPADADARSVRATKLTTEPKDIMKESGDTWNEDTSPSFPSISLTAPLITPYKSLEEDPIKPEVGIIHLESGKVGLISHLEMESSMNSLDLEGIRPPSCMGSLLSLTASVSEADKRRQTPSRSLLTRRITHTDSSLSWNNLDSIKPPSGMDEVMELENSILSCASLISEVADSPMGSPTNSISEDITLAPDTEPLTSLTPRLTPKMKRQVLKDRYNTYTITGDKSSRDSSLDAEVNLDSEIAEPPIEPSKQPNSPAKPKKLTPKQKRLADQERFRTRTLGDQQIPVPLSPKERRLAQKERYKTQTLNEPILTSENLPEIHTFSAELKIAEEASALQNEESDYEIEGEKSDDEKPKPIVVKPSEVKSVRGRKKARSHIPVVNRSPANKSKSPKAPAPLQRQGTFTKDEPQTIPVASGIPVFSSAKKQISVKTGLKKKTTSIPPASTTPQIKNVKTAAASAGRGRAGSLPRSDPLPNASGVRSSKSNQSLKSETLGSNTSLSSGGARWNSNSSLNTPGVKKEATSKIASLWKKVEDSKKKKEAEGKDTRVWIGPNSIPPHSKQAV